MGSDETVLLKLLMGIYTISRCDAPGAPLFAAFRTGGLRCMGVGSISPQDYRGCTRRWSSGCSSRWCGPTASAALRRRLFLIRGNAHVRDNAALWMGGYLHTLDIIFQIRTGGAKAPTTYNMDLKTCSTRTGTDYGLGFGVGVCVGVGGGLYTVILGCSSRLCTGINY